MLFIECIYREPQLGSAYNRNDAYEPELTALRVSDSYSANAERAGEGTTSTLEGSNTQANLSTYPEASRERFATYRQCSGFASAGRSGGRPAPARLPP